MKDRIPTGELQDIVDEMLLRVDHRWSTTRRPGYTPIRMAQCRDRLVCTIILLILILALLGCGMIVATASEATIGLLLICDLATMPLLMAAIVLLLVEIGRKEA